MFKKNISVFYVVLINIFLFGTALTALAECTPTFEEPICPPKLEVKVPFLKEFEQIDCSEGQACEVPWFAQYIAGVYKFSYTVAGILALVMILIGGMMWAGSAGNQNVIAKAKELITGAIAGLIIVLCTYMILYMINPELTAPKAISIEVLDFK